MRMKNADWETIPLPDETMQLVVVLWECTRSHCRARVSSVFTGRAQPSQTLEFVRCPGCNKPYQVTLPAILVESFWPQGSKATPVNGRESDGSPLPDNESRVEDKEQTST